MLLYEKRLLWFSLCLIDHFILSFQLSSMIFLAMVNTIRIKV